MEKVLVTGANGFVGQHVVDTLQQYDCEIIGLTKSSEIDDTLAQKLDVHVVCDLTKPEQVAELALQGITGVINLAGIAVNNPNEPDSANLISTNISVHTNLYEQFMRQGVSPRIIAVSSGAVYSPNQPMPLTEDSELASGATAYVASKIAMEQAIKPYTTMGLDIIITRPFNHTAPLQGPSFLVPDWAERLSTLEKGQSVDVSRLGSWRDFLDARDVAAAYTSILQTPEHQLTTDTYNICSGRPLQTYHVIQLLANELGVELPFEEKPSSESVIYGSSDTLTQDTGWKQKIPLEKTIRDFANWYSSKL
ncbi:NAD(P)-dependent oxidoreductase [bacterium]|nr:NAD(P)-dependent oxidoreductase [bacterium]